MAVKVRLPRLLDANRQEVCRLRPSAMALQNRINAAGTATMTLPLQDAAPAMHDWVELYTAKGSAGLFRVTNVAHQARLERTYTLLHGIDTLSDSVWAAQTDYNGTGAGYLAALLSHQKTVYWQLGTCQDSAAWKKTGINYDKISDLLADFVSNRHGYYLAYDFTTWPWTLHWLQLPQTVSAEWRLRRNIHTCTVTRNDADLCTRLYFCVTSTNVGQDGSGGTTTTVTVHNNAAAQAIYGIVEKTATVDTEDVADTAAWAAQFMDDHAEPAVQITIDGDELAALTGDPWDGFDLGRLTRCALAEDGITVNERVVGVSYPDVLGEPEHVVVEMANTLPKFSDSIASASKTASSASATAKSAKRGGAGTAKKLDHWSMVVTQQQEALDGTGITQLYETGIELDPVTGAKIYTLGQGFQSEYAELLVQRGNISTLVTKTGINDLGASETLYTRIRQTETDITTEAARAQGAEETIGSRVTQNASSITSIVSKTGVDNLQDNDSLYSRIQQTASDITSEVSRAQNAEQGLSGSISTVQQTADAVSLEVANARGNSATLSARFTVTDTAISSEVTNRQNADSGLSSRITQNADAISLKVSQGDVATQLTVELDNVTISNNNLVVEGYITSEGLETAIANIGTMRTGNIQAAGNISASGGVTASGLYIGTSAPYSSVANAIASFGTATESGGQISIPTTTLGGGAGPSINFNIAATQKYIDDVAAAKIYGASHAAIGGSWSGGVYTVNVSYGGSVRQSQAMTELDEITLNGTPTTTNYTIIAPCKVTDTDGNVLLTDNVTVSGWDAYENGQDSVTIQKSAWTNNHCYFTKSAGASSTESVALSAGNMYSAGMIVKVPILDYGVSTGLEVEVDTTYPYNQGYISGYNANTTARVNQSTQTLSYGQSVTVKAQYCDYDGTLHDSSSSCTITAPSAPATVYVVKGSWSGGIITFSPSSGTGASKTVQLSKGTESWSGNSCSFPIMDGQGSTGYTCTVNAASRYNAGVSAGYIDGYKAGWNACIDAATGVSCLTDYYEWNNRDSTRLYYHDGSAWVTATGNSQRWVYGGSVKTKFTLPAKM